MPGPDWGYQRGDQNVRSGQPHPLLTLTERGFSPDILLVSTVLVATVLAVALDVPGIVRVPLALTTTLFVPGYTATIALFPAGTPRGMTSPSWEADQPVPEPENGITTVERTVLSVGLSTAIILLVGLFVNAVIGAVTVWTLLLGLVGSTLGVLPIALIRRHRTSQEHRFLPLASGLLTGENRPIFNSWKSIVMSTVLAISILFAAGAVMYSEGGTGVGPLNPEGSGEISSSNQQSNVSVTEFYFLADGPVDENRTDRYPTEFTAGDSQTVSLAIGNREGEPLNYSVVGQIHRVQGDDTVTVVQQWRVPNDDVVDVPAGDRREINDTVTPLSHGENLRLVYLLYTESPPDTPTITNAYREIHVWITVTEPSAE